MGDCRKRNILQTGFEGKKACKDIPENTNVLHWKKYFSWRIMLKKNFTPLYVGEKLFNSRGLKKNSSRTKSPIPRRKTQMVNSLRGGGRKRLDTSVNVIHQQNGWQNGIAIRFLIQEFCSVLLFFDNSCPGFSWISLEWSLLRLFSVICLQSILAEKYAYSERSEAPKVPRLERFIISSRAKRVYHAWC